MRKFFGAALSVIFCLGWLPAQTNNIGKVIPMDSFGITFYNNALVPELPYGTVRSWDSQRVSWNFLNPSSGTYDWTTLDAWTNAHAGKDMLYTFGLTPTWAASHPDYATPYRHYSSCSMPKNMSDWDAFVTAIATHAGKKVKYWELWNEPMNYQYWCHGPDAASDFAVTGTMFAHAYTILKRIIPDAVILGPSIDKDFGLAWMSYYFHNGGTVSWDVMAVHGYPDTNPIPPESMVPMLSKYTAYMAEHGMKNMPIWDTETAWTKADSAWVSKMFILSWSLGVSRTIWYAYDIGMPLWNATTGLSDAGIGYSTLYSWLVGATLTAPCSQDKDGTYSCSITRNGHRGEILWNSKAAVSFTAPAGMKQYRDIRGGVHSVSSGAVSVGNSPVLLESS